MDSAQFSLKHTVNVTKTVTHTAQQLISTHFS